MKKRVRFKKILNLLFYCVDMDFCSYKIGNVRTKVRLGVKRKVTHCLSKKNILINKQRQIVHLIQTKL